MENKKLVFPLSVKIAESADGTFSGYGSVFDVVDSYQDAVVRGAFSESISNRMPALLWQHNSDFPIGIFTDVREDSLGLYVKGQLNLEVQKGREAYSLLKQGAISGLSIGFRTIEEESENDIRYLKKIDLWEVSLVTFPANQSATVTSVKNAEDIKTERDFERLLREVGFSNNKAKAITAKGFKAANLRESDLELCEIKTSLEKAISILKK